MNIDELNEIINNLDNDDNLKKEIILFFQPFIKFNEYMLKTYNKTFNDINFEIEQNKQNFLEEKLKKKSNTESKIEDIINEISNIYKNYALKYKYPNIDEYQKATKKYLEYILKKTITKK